MEFSIWAAVAVAYLIGSIDFAIFVGRLHGVDIRSEGSGNPGTANVFRVLGTFPGIMVLVGDLLKGVVAAVLGAWLAAAVNPEAVLDPVNSWHCDAGRNGCRDRALLSPISQIPGRKGYGDPFSGRCSSSCPP